MLTTDQIYKAAAQRAKTDAVTQSWLYLVIIPLIIGAIVGAVTAKLKPHSIKLTLISTSALSLAFLAVVLLTLQRQSAPQLAIMFATISIIMMNISALISHRLISRKFKVNK